MAYQYFASFYDQLMADSPYEQWAQIAMEAGDLYGNKGRHILDIGCGTGEVSVRLAQQNYQVTGIDLSEEMLAIAQAKADDQKCHIDLFQQDMREINLPNTFDIAVIFCDSLNYLASLEDVQSTFSKVNAHLEPDGLFMFDVHTQHKVNNLFLNSQFCESDDTLSYIWECFEGPYPDSVYHDLSFFSRQPSGLYQRFDETHMQRTFSESTYRQCLKETGFECVAVTSDFTSDKPNNDSERIFFICKKK